LTKKGYFGIIIFVKIDAHKKQLSRNIFCVGWKIFLKYTVRVKDFAAIRLVDACGT